MHFDVIKIFYFYKTHRKDKFMENILLKRTCLYISHHS